MDRIFFIIGVGRSGTSLLQSILSSHSEIGMPPETGFLRNAFFRFEKYYDVSYENFLKLFPRLERIQSCFSNNRDKNFSDALAFYRFMLENGGYEADTKIRGDKDPRLIEYMSGTCKIFPQAKFIHLVRDPRDVLLSKKKAAWSKGRPSWYHIFANYIQLKIGEAAGKTLSEQKYMVTTYEEILNTPQKTISKICTFLKMDFEPAMLAFQEKAKELVSDEETQWKKETMGPLLKNNTSKWKGKLEPSEVALTENLCCQAFEIGGYVYSNAINALPFYKKIVLNFASSLLKVLGCPYIFYRKYYQTLILWWKR